MPKRLLERCRRECIAEFRAAARQRFLDGLSLLGADRRTAAVYVWGYSAEMTLKAAYFRVIGFPEAQPITLNDLKNAKDMATKTLKIPWPGNFHDLAKWAELLVTRRTHAGLAYSVSGFGNRVVHESTRLHRLWREDLRYHRNVAYTFEVNQARASVEWLLVNSALL